MHQNNCDRCSNCSNYFTHYRQGKFCAECNKRFHASCFGGHETKCNTCLYKNNCLACAKPTVQPRELRSLEKKINELKQIVIDLKGITIAGNSARRTATEIKPAPVVVKNTTNQETQTADKMPETPKEVETKKSSSLDATKFIFFPTTTTYQETNKTKAAILEAIKLKPITELEIQYRRYGHDLPKFNGDPTTWFVFSTLYQETTTKCKFSDYENMIRVQQALEEPARSKVSCYFGMPHRHQEMMDMLKKLYGRPEAVQGYLTSLAIKTPKLREDLSNISEFFAVVMKIVDALKMMENENEGPVLVELLVDKLDMQIRREWVRFLAKREVKADFFLYFIDDLFKDYMSLRGRYVVL